MKEAVADEGSHRSVLRIKIVKKMMRKLLVLLVLVLGIIQFAEGQYTFIRMCEGDSYTWHFGTSPSSQVIIRAIIPGSITYDTINGNQIVLSPQEHTTYNIISIDGNAYTCDEALEIEVIELLPTISISGQSVSISVSSNLNYSIALYVHVTDNNNALVYRCYSQTGNIVNIDNIPQGDYKVYITTEDTNCQITLPITIF